MAFKMNGWSAFKDDPEKKETAQFRSYDEMINSQRYKDALKTKKPNTFTYWDMISDEPGGEEYKVVQTETTGTQD